MPIDVETQYDKLYRYCYFKLHDRDAAEDVTQEAFLRYFERYRHLSETSALKCLYTFARNLCTDVYRRPSSEWLREDIPDPRTEDALLTRWAVGSALSGLTADEQELLLLRYVNEVPMSVIGEMYRLSRFAVYRRTAAACRKFREALQKEDAHE